MGDQEVGALEVRRGRHWEWSGVWDSDVTILRCWQGMQAVIYKML